MEAPAPGLYPDIPLDEYLAWGLPRKSWFSECLRSPAHLRAWLERNEETDAMREGSLFHCALLEPGKLAERYVLARKFGLTNAEKAEKAAFYDTCAQAGVEPVSSELLGNAKAMALAVRANPIVKTLLTGTEVELSFVWKEPETGLLTSGRLDVWCTSENVILDVKTCRDSRMHAFGGDVERYHYHVGAAFYRDAMLALLSLDSAPTFLFLAIEREPPYASAIYELEPAWLEAGRQNYVQALKAIKTGQETATWIAYDPKILMLERPAWAKRLPLPGKLDPMPF